MLMCAQLRTHRQQGKNDRLHARYCAPLFSRNRFQNRQSEGYVPVLQVDKGQILSGGPAIVQCLADYVPQKHLPQ